MNHKSTSKNNHNNVTKTINDLENLTFFQVFQVLAHLKISVIGTIVFAFLTWSGFVYNRGVTNVEKETALFLYKRFDMEIHLEDEKGNAKVRKFSKVNLAPKPKHRQMAFGYAVLDIRRVRKSPRDTESIGEIHAEEENIKQAALDEDFNHFSWLRPAQAQGKFKWEGHQDNYNFHEKYVNKNTIRRIYENGSVLEYKVDGKGRSIPATFRWVKICSGGFIFKQCRSA